MDLSCIVRDMSVQSFVTVAQPQNSVYADCTTPVTLWPDPARDPVPKKGNARMTARQRATEALEAAARLRDEGDYAGARTLLAALADHPDAGALGETDRPLACRAACTPRCCASPRPRAT